MLNKIKGAIFDIDGTLLDSMHIWKNVAADYLISQGMTPRPGLNDKLLAMGGHEIPQYFQSEYGLRGTLEDIQSGIYSLLEDFYRHTAALKDGVFPLLNALRDRGIPMCAATATNRWLMEPALHRCGLFEYFMRIFTCSEERTSKSSPDIFIRAAAFMGTAIEHTVVFEDAPYAVRSAKSAGFLVAGVYDKSADDKQDEIKELCDYYFKSLTDFTP